MTHIATPADSTASESVARNIFSNFDSIVLVRGNPINITLGMLRHSHWYLLNTSDMQVQALTVDLVFSISSPMLVVFVPLVSTFFLLVV